MRTQVGLAGCATVAATVAVGLYLYRRASYAKAGSENTPSEVTEKWSRKSEVTEKSSGKLLRKIARSEYSRLFWSIPTVSLLIKLDDPEQSGSFGKPLTTVEADLSLVHSSDDAISDLSLHFEDLNLLEISVDGRRLKMSEFGINPDMEVLVVRAAALSATCTLRTIVAIDPVANLQLQGLYQSGGIFCTQMEAEGYRRMTPHLDRPDVLSVYTVRVEADVSSCPVLLSNGNKTKSGKLAGGRHFAIYHDPWPKPSYLFGLVAGDLGSITSSFSTCSGRKVALAIYTEPAMVGQLDFAMECIKKAMAWDEEQFGREYDLDVFNIVAVTDFNMGAMENKSLNIFNSKCVLALPTTATDATMRRVEGIIGAYAHTRTGLSGAKR